MTAPTTLENAFRPRPSLRAKGSTDGDLARKTATGGAMCRYVIRLRRTASSIASGRKAGMQCTAAPAGTARRNMLSSP